MIVDPRKIVTETIKDKVQVSLIINNRAGGNAPDCAPCGRLKELRTLGLLSRSKEMKIREDGTRSAR